MTSAAERTSVSAERLLQRAEVPVTRLRGPAARLAERAAERSVRLLLHRLSREQLTLHHDAALGATSTTFGRRGVLHAHVTVHDRRAYVALLREGSIGLGRGYIEGWWSSDQPVHVVQVIIRNIGWLDRLRNRLQRVTGPLADRRRLRHARHTRQRNRLDIGAHYDIGNEFFELFLDETMTYSSAIFRSPEDTLARASLNKYDVLLGKLQLTADHHLLEIGTGWGGLAIHAARTIGCSVTSTTISTEQHREAQRRVDAAGLSERVSLLSSDWRDLNGTFDRVISIEMIEAVDWREYDAFFSMIEQRMRIDGLAAIQAICVPDSRFERTKNTEDFIKRFVFPNGFLPSVGAMTAAIHRSTGMRVLQVDDYGAHYAETLRRWHDTFLQRREQVMALGLDERFCRLWSFYLAYCEAGFREEHCTVVQLVLGGSQHSA
jgi:cyclopropane-fatty-acyl-phospholipid synthase